MCIVGVLLLLVIIHCSFVLACDVPVSGGSRSALENAALHHEASCVFHGNKYHESQKSPNRQNMCLRAGCQTKVLTWLFFLLSSASERLFSMLKCTMLRMPRSARPSARHAKSVGSRADSGCLRTSESLEQRGAERRGGLARAWARIRDRAEARVSRLTARALPRSPRRSRQNLSPRGPGLIEDFVHVSKSRGELAASGPSLDPIPWVGAAGTRRTES